MSLNGGFSDGLTKYGETLERDTDMIDKVNVLEAYIKAYSELQNTHNELQNHADRLVEKISRLVEYINRNQQRKRERAEQVADEVVALGDTLSDEAKARLLYYSRYKDHLGFDFELTLEVFQEIRRPFMFSLTDHEVRQINTSSVWVDSEETGYGDINAITQNYDTIGAFLERLDGDVSQSLNGFYFMKSQGMTFDEFCQDFDDNMMLAMLTQ